MKYAWIIKEVPYTLWEIAYARDRLNGEQQARKWEIQYVSTSRPIIYMKIGKQWRLLHKLKDIILDSTIQIAFKVAICSTA